MRFKVVFLGVYSYSSLATIHHEWSQFSPDMLGNTRFLFPALSLSFCSWDGRKFVEPGHNYRAYATHVPTLHWDWADPIFERWICTLPRSITTKLRIHKLWKILPEDCPTILTIGSCLQSRLNQVLGYDLSALQNGCERIREFNCWSL